MEYTKEQLKEKFEKLPADIRRVLLSEEVGINAQIIGRDTDITSEQALDVEDEVVAILMGTSHPKDFIQNIQTKIGVDQEKARAIAERVNEEIFQPVKDSLKIVHNITEGTSETTQIQMSTPVSTPPAPLNIPTPPAPPSSTTTSFPQIIVPPKMNVEIKEKPLNPTPPEPQNIFEQKLQGIFKMPKKETVVPSKSSSHQPSSTGNVDPYREPAL